VKLLVVEKLLELQQGKSPTEKVEVDNEFGMQLECSVAPESGDIIEDYEKSNQ
jgi:hypothetical protein